MDFFKVRGRLLRADTGPAVRLACWGSLKGPHNASKKAKPPFGKWGYGGLGPHYFPLLAVLRYNY